METLVPDPNWVSARVFGLSDAAPRQKSTNRTVGLLPGGVGVGRGNRGFSASFRFSLLLFLFFLCLLLACRFLGVGVCCVVVIASLFVLLRVASRVCRIALRLRYTASSINSAAAS